MFNKDEMLYKKNEYNITLNTLKLFVKVTRRFFFVKITRRFFFVLMINKNKKRKKNFFPIRQLLSSHNFSKQKKKEKKWGKNEK